MGIEKVGVIGCGSMGSGIAQVILQGGHRVVVRESGSELLEAGLKRVEKAMAKQAARNGTSESVTLEALGRLSGTLALEDLNDCDLVIEAVFEELRLKQDLFGALDAACKKETIFASNTSSLSITEMAASTRRPSRFVGLHFFNPAHVIPLVEVVRTLSTHPEVLECILAFSESIGKIPVIAKDNAGFIVNLLLTPFMLDAMRAASSGTASIGDIDKAMKLGCNHPMGPLMLADFIGLDIILNAGNVMFEEYRDGRYAPPPILKKLVTIGNRGLKSGRGFYDWADPKNPVPSILDG